MRISRTLAFCLALTFFGCVAALSQVGGDRRRTAATPTPRPTSRRTPRPTPKPKPPPTPQPPSQSVRNDAADEAASERVYWESILSSTDPEDFRVYLKKYPGGVYADVALTRLQQLEAKPTSTTGATTTAPPTSTSRREGTVVGNQMGMELVYVPAGLFRRGSENGRSDEYPVHQVVIREGFYIGRYEVTQAQWQAVMGSNPSNFKGCDQCPVEQVSWNNAQEFIQGLNARGDGYKYRLPTEAEWEYAARAGTTTAFAFGDSLSSDQANFDGNYPYGGAAKGVYRQKTTHVGSFQPNGWGLYDMHGNVWEWCEDRYHESYHGAPTDGSAWLSGGEQESRVVRGGSWLTNANLLRSAYRRSVGPRYSSLTLGFRVVAVARS